MSLESRAVINPGDLCMLNKSCWLYDTYDVDHDDCLQGSNSHLIFNDHGVLFFCVCIMGSYAYVFNDEKRGWVYTHYLRSIFQHE